MLRREFHRRVFETGGAGLLAVVGGCGKEEIFPQSDYEKVVLFGIDLSGSFADKMLETGHAHEFVNQGIEHYFRDSIGTSDRLIIFQLSGNADALLWEGRPLDLRRRDFPTPKAFHDFLKSKSDRSGSLINEGICEAVSYVMNDPGVASGRAKSGMVICSDMLSNGPNPEESGRKLINALGSYARTGAFMGIYFCNQHLVGTWRSHLQSVGFRAFRVESEINGRPSFPNFA